jgi:hypothetical protein
MKGSVKEGKQEGNLNQKEASEKKKALKFRDFISLKSGFWWRSAVWV